MSETFTYDSKSIEKLLGSVNRTMRVKKGHMCREGYEVMVPGRVLIRV